MHGSECSHQFAGGIKVIHGHTGHRHGLTFACCDGGGHVHDGRVGIVVKQTDTCRTIGNQVVIQVRELRIAKGIFKRQGQQLSSVARRVVDELDGDGLFGHIRTKSHAALRDDAADKAVTRQGGGSFQGVVQHHGAVQSTATGNLESNDAALACPAALVNVGRGRFSQAVSGGHAHFEGRGHDGADDDCGDFVIDTVRCAAQHLSRRDVVAAIGVTHDVALQHLSGLALDDLLNSHNFSQHCNGVFAVG